MKATGRKKPSEYGTEKRTYENTHWTAGQKAHRAAEYSQRQNRFSGTRCERFPAFVGIDRPSIGEHDDVVVSVGSPVEIHIDRKPGRIHADLLTVTRRPDRNHHALNYLPS